jgi:hypothetical protein
MFPATTVSILEDPSLTTVQATLAAAPNTKWAKLTGDLALDSVFSLPSCPVSTSLRLSETPSPSSSSAPVRTTINCDNLPNSLRIALSGTGLISSELPTATNLLYLLSSIKCHHLLIISTAMWPSFKHQLNVSQTPFYSAAAR